MKGGKNKPRKQLCTSETNTVPLADIPQGNKQQQQGQVEKALWDAKQDCKVLYHMLTFLWELLSCSNKSNSLKLTVVHCSFFLEGLTLGQKNMNWKYLSRGKLTERLSNHCCERREYILRLWSVFLAYD